MTSAYKPTDEKELAQLISWAAAESKPLELVGSGTKRALGCPVAGGEVAPAKVDLSAIAGVVFYEPEELVISLRPGTPLDQVSQMLAERTGAGCWRARARPAPSAAPSRWAARGRAG
jgi:glycolate oxidase FAD binding subunit